MKKGSVKNKYKGLTFAQASKKISAKYPNRDTNLLEKRSYEEEMLQLVKLQEIMRAKELALETIKENSKPRQASDFKYGGKLKYDNGGGFATDDTVLNTDNILDNGVNLLNPAGEVPQLPILAPSPIKYNPSYSSKRTLEDIKNIANTTGNVNSADVNKPEIFDNIYTPVALGKGLEFAGKLAMLAGGYDKVSPEYNPYEYDIKRRMQRRGIDLTSVKENTMSSENKALENISNIRSEAIKQALQNSIFRGTQKNLADVSLQEQQISNQYDAEYANTLNQLGQQKVRANQYAEQLNTASKAGFQLGIQNILESVGQFGQEVTNLKAGQRQQSILSEVLKTKNFELANAEEVLQKAARGEDVTLSDMIKIVNSNGGSKDEALELYKEYKKRKIGNK